MSKLWKDITFMGSGKVMQNASTLHQCPIVYKIVPEEGPDQTKWELGQCNSEALSWNPQKLPLNDLDCLIIKDWGISSFRMFLHGCCQCSFLSWDYGSTGDHYQSHHSGFADTMDLLWRKVCYHTIARGYYCWMSPLHLQAMMISVSTSGQGCWNGSPADTT